MRVTPLRVLFVLPFLVIAARFVSFIDHVAYFLSGEVSRTIITGNWQLVAVNIVLFLGFILFLRVRRSIDWQKEHIGGIGIYAAFIVSLFVEMYGIPLTIFLGSGVVQGPTAAPDAVMTVKVLGTVLSLNLWMLLGVGVTAAGMALIAVGWWQVYTAEGLVTDGLYQYSRNPQYAGFLLIALGWVIGWPTMLTLVLFPLLAAAYVHLCRVEQEDMLAAHGKQYEEYMQQTPLLL